MIFEQWLYQTLASAVPSGSKMSTVSGDGQVSLRLADGNTVSRFVRQGIFLLDFSSESKKAAADGFEHVMSTVETLADDHHYVMAVDVNTTDALRQGEPARWVYTAQITVTYRRDVDWGAVD